MTLCANVRAAAPALQLERTIPLPKVAGRIDHMAVDLGRKRLFVAELGNNTVDVIDLASGKVAHRIEGLKEPQGIGYAPKEDVIAIANAGDGSVRLFHGADFAPLGTVALGDDADNIRLDPYTGQFVVGYGAGGLAMLDPASGSVVARVRLSAHPESFQLDPAARRAFVNVPECSTRLPWWISLPDVKRQAGLWRIYAPIFPWREIRAAHSLPWCFAIRRASCSWTLQAGR